MGQICYLHAIEVDGASPLNPGGPRSSLNWTNWTQEPSPVENPKTLTEQDSTEEEQLKPSINQSRVHSDVFENPEIHFNCMEVWKVIWK